MPPARIIEQVRALNAHGFGADDYYSDEGNLKESLASPKAHLLTTRAHGQITGYYLIKEHELYVEGVRLAVAPTARGGGLGKKLVRRALRFAGQRSKPFKTYCSSSNLRSATLHVQAGMALTSVDADWINFATR